MSPKARYINIINVYAPTSERAKKFLGETEKMYNDLNKLCKEMDKISTSNIIIAEDFNAKIGKRNENKPLLMHDPTEEQKHHHVRSKFDTKHFTQSKDAQGGCNE